MDAIAHLLNDWPATAARETLQRETIERLADVPNEPHDWVLLALLALDQASVPEVDQLRIVRQLKQSLLGEW
jgi:hypothetical protein